MKRLFQIASVTKPGQKNSNTKFDKKKIFTGEPRGAAMKAMTHLCSSKMKKIKGVCTLTVVVREVKRHTVNGVETTSPVLDSTGLEKLYKYKVKRHMYHEDNTPDGRMMIAFPGKNVHFKYHVEIVESYGRVLI